MARGTGPGGFVGRDAELARLRDALVRADGGDGAVVIVSGEAGIGKSRLLDEFLVRVDPGAATVLSGSCLPSTGPGTPYGPFVEALRALARTIGQPRLLAMAGPGRSELGRLLPELAVARPPQAAAPAGAEAIAEQHGQARLFEAVLAVVEGLARDASVIVAIDDLQWADAGTRDLAHFLVRNLRGARVLFLLLLRTDELDPTDPNLAFVAELGRDAGVERLELAGLGPREAAAVVRSRVPDDVPTAAVDRLVERASGNPFFLEQLVAAQVATDGPGLPRLTPGLRDVLAARLAALPARTRQVLRAAAAAGRRVDDEVLATVLDAPHDDVAEAIREARARGILVEETTISPAGASREAGYRFRHALLREMAYAELLYGERERLHAAYARELERRGRIAGVPVTSGELADHWVAAGDVERAIPQLVQAGLEAEGVYAFTDARQRYALALELWPAGGTPPPGVAVDRPELLRRAADSALLGGDYAGAVELGRRAVDALGELQGADPLRAGAAHERLRWYLWQAGDLPAATAAIEEALAILPAAPPSAARARALAHLAGIRLMGGHPEDAEAPALEALEVARAASASPELALALGILGWVRAAAGDVDGGIATYREGLGLAEELGGVEGIALGRANLAALLDHAGRSEEVVAAAEEGIDTARRLGVARTYGGLLAAHAVKALFDLGDWLKATTLATEWLALDPVGPGALRLNVWSARLATNTGRLGDAARHLAAADALVRRPGQEHGMAAAVAVAAVELALHAGDLDAVRAEAGRPLRAGGAPGHATGWVTWFAARAEADASEPRAAGASRAQGGPAEAVEPTFLSATAAGLVRSPGRSPADDRRRALGELALAELDRAAEHPDVAAWRTIAARWTAIGRPPIVAYARYREAEAALRSGVHGPPAEAPLREAATVARRVGAAPLLAEITRLARHARIELAPGSTDGRDAASAEADAPTVDLARRLGLTPRELEVLPLVAEGLSNQEIADELFITRKTASVHVSNLMAKLGVDNRIQAAVVARRVGLVTDARDQPPSMG